MLVSNASEIALSLHPSPISDVSAFKRMRALVSNCAGLLPEWIKASSRSRSSALSFTTYFLTAISFPDTNHLHHLILATEIQKITTDLMTLVTSGATPIDCPAFGFAHFAGDPIAVLASVLAPIGSKSLLFPCAGERTGN